MSVKMVLVRIQKTIIIDNDMEQWKSLFNVGGSGSGYGHWEKDKWQAGSEGDSW